MGQSGLLAGFIELEVHIAPAAHGNCAGPLWAGSDAGKVADKMGIWTDPC